LTNQPVILTTRHWANASLLSINSYFAANSTMLLAGAVLATLGALAILWFAGHLRHLRHVLQRAEGGAEAFAPLVLAPGSRWRSRNDACLSVPATVSPHAAPVVPV
jgi:hypothetical protein